MSEKEIQQVIDELYGNIDGFEISRRGREKHPISYIGYRYGELTTNNLCQILTKIAPRKGQVFYDLGSGIGKQVITSSLFSRFSKCVGVETISDLYQTSEKVLSRFNKNVGRNLSSEDDSTLISFVHDDYYKYDFSDGDVVLLFISPEALYFELNGSMLNKLLRLKKGARVITDRVPILNLRFCIKLRKAKQAQGDAEYRAESSRSALV